jgi:major type 1 subunit fimbrin (pilin)
MNLNASNAGSGSGWNFGFAIQFAFVKTGVITGGVATVSGKAAEAGVDSSPATTPSNVANINLTGSATFVVLACITPDVRVPMGSHPNTEFSGADSTTAAVSFNIALNSCPAGMNSIQYRIDPVTSVLNSGQSVVALDSSSSATGVGVQLLDAAGAVFPLSTQKTFSGYNAGTGGSYTIPMKARYYQTGTSVSGGAANSSMTFTMTYQ